MNRFPIYPDFKTVITGSLSPYAAFPDINISILTTIRKLHSDGNYYLQDLVSERIFKQTDFKWDKALDVCLRDFTKECYLVIKLGKVDPDIVFGDGRPTFELDPDQTPEEERLMKMMKP